MTTLLTRTLALAAAALLLLGPACGGSDTPTEAEDEAAAARMVLTSADLPGFELEPEDDEDDEESPFDKCVDNPLFTSEDQPRGADGGDYTQDDGNVRVQSGALLTVKESEAREAFADLERALSSQCLRDGLKAGLEDDADPGLQVGDVTTSPLPALDLDGQSAGSRLTIPLEADGESVSLFVDMTVLRDGRVVAGVFLLQIGSPFPDAERIRLATLVAERMGGKIKNTPDSESPDSESSQSTATTAETAPGGATRFRDPSGVSLEKAPTWTVEASGGGDPLVLFIDPARGVPFRRNVTITRESAEQPITLDEYTEFTLQEIADLGGTVGESRPTTLSGAPAYRVSYRAELDGDEYRALAVWTIRDGEVWLVTYTSDLARYNPGLPEIETLLTSIELPD